MLLCIGIQSSAAALEQAEGSPLADEAWVRLGGPIGGLGYDIRMRPDEPDTMYVTDAWAGAHKSIDGGRTWFTLNDGIDARTGPSGDAIPVFCLTIDPNDHDIVWIGLQDLGAVYRSDDGGQTWQKRINGITEGQGLTIRGITVEPGNSDVVYAAGEIGSWKWAGEELWGRGFDRVQGVVYRSTDGGANWEAIWRGDNLARYVWIHPNDHDVIYVSTGIFDREAANSDPEIGYPGGEGILKSTDGGRTWVNINNGLGNLYVGSLFMHPEDPDILLAGTANNTYRENGGIYMTTDGGDHWRHVGGRDITSVEFSSSNPDIAYAGGQGEFYRSEDGGNTWIPFMPNGEFGWGPEGIHPGFPIDFQVDPRDPYRVFVNNYGGGNFLSEDGGETWAIASVGYTGADLTDVSADQTNPAFVVANGRSGPFLSHDGGINWTGINPMDPHIPQIGEGARAVVDPSDSQHLFLSSAHWGWTYETFDGGKTWELVTEYFEELESLPVELGGAKHQGFQAIAFSPSDPQIVYGGFGIHGCIAWADPPACEAETIVSFLLSTDGGSTWKRMTGTPFDGKTVSEIVVHPSDSDIAWLATAGGGVYYTEDLGQTWNPGSEGLGSRLVMDLAGDPNEPNILFAGTASRGVFKSEDGGRSWRAMSAGMDPNESIFSVAIDPVRPNVVYAGSSRSGVFVSEDGGASWRLINDGLTTRGVNCLSISGDGETLYAGTRGGGIFRLSTHDQSYYDELAPTTTVAPATDEPTAPLSTAVLPDAEPTGKSTGSSLMLLLYIGAPVVVLLAGLAVVWLWRREAKG
jgi:photosystem II stability/assembly factor-like uncharacterized protein